ncbi:hypothetical protein ACFQ3R_00630 [Mesonia ostreae]|uniref:Uncharacterized protein n=1 Tax=Mesonia ostreae TaxID=861110 RepID=A0ABU2KJH0_9FLAO|nr:hypothetical protein [Mesonia ostreae]MDT0294803.1 hypothetical protein [Mesonia ostreae]
MNIFKFLRKDYYILILIGIIGFIALKQFIPASINLLLCIIVAFYFFPGKILLGILIKKEKKLSVISIFTYFIISIQVIFSGILILMEEDSGLFYNILLVTGIVLFALMIYHYFKEGIKYNFILTLMAVIFVPSSIMVLTNL